MTSPIVTGSGSSDVNLVVVVSTGFSVEDVVVIDCGGTLLDETPYDKITYKIYSTLETFEVKKYTKHEQMVLKAK